MIHERSFSAFLTAFGLLLTACTVPPEDSDPVATAGAGTALRLGEIRRDALEAAGARRHPLDLRLGEAAWLEIDQEEVDVEVEILDPQGRSLLSFDSPTGREAPERICFVAATDGRHTVRVAPFGSAAGEYAIRLVHRRPATATDRLCAGAARGFMAARGDEGAPLKARIAAYERAHALWRAAGEPFLAAVALREAGSLWLRFGLGDRAAERFREALPLAREAESDSLEVSLLNRLGWALLDIDELAGAEEALRRALDAARRAGNQRGEASALSNLGLVEESLGEPHRAIERYREALSIWERLGAVEDRAQTLKNLADSLALLDLHDEALLKLGQALPLAERAGSLQLQANLLTSVGWTQYLRGHPEEAIPPLRQALDLNRRLRNRNGEAAILDRLGTMLKETGDFAGGEEAYRQSLALSRAAGNLADAASTLANIGCLYQRWGKTREALPLLADARRRFERIRDPKAISHIEFCLARAEWQRGDLDAAIRHIEEAIAVVDSLRHAARTSGDLYRPIWLWQDYAELHLELLMARHRATGEERYAGRAFEASDLAHARNLYELVLESRVGVRAAAGEEVLARERTVRGRLDVRERHRRDLVAAGAPTAEIAAVEAELAELELELEEARADIRASDPRYADLVAPRPVRLEDLQRLLDPRTVLLSYALGAEGSYLFVARREGLSSWRLEVSREHLEAQAETLHRALRDTSPDQEQQRLLALRLSRMLLPPEAIPPETRRLLIVADGALHYVPFAVLPVPGREERLLVDDFEIRYLPSAAVLVALRRRDARRRAPKTVAVVADAVFSPADPRLHGVPNAPPSSGVVPRAVGVARLPQGPLPRLPATAEEARAIFALVPEGERWGALGFGATKQALVEQPLHLYRILHFATHALIDERFPDLSGLVFSRRNAEGGEIDGDLRLHEIYGLRLAADLVVLSGCQTALGQHVRGDGLLSLTRGFLYAGSSQVMVSLWNVYDEPTAALMAEFYRGLLGRGQSPAAALRSAQLRMRRHPVWHAPHYWAAFVLQGDEG